MKITKDRIIFLIIVLILVAITSAVSTYATSYLFNSNEVSYNNNATGIASDNVQGAIDKLYEEATNYSEMRKLIYPVGSIYISVTDDTVAKVEARYGGEWESFGTGKTLVGVDTSDTDFDTIEEANGTKSESYTPAGTNSGGSVNGYALKNADLPKLSGSAYFRRTSGGGSIVMSASGIFSRATISSSNTSYNQISSSTVAQQDQLNINIGGGGSHSHGFTNPTFTGTAATISHIQPYITVYMYKRVS